jgi:hypothetical protein
MFENAMTRTSSVEIQPGEPGPALKSSVDQPNLPEVSGTSFPLLTTVLAGFAVTIAVQLIISPDVRDEASALVTTSILIFLASTLVFISSIVFAVNAQAHNYLPFVNSDDAITAEFGIADRSRWLAWLHQGWDMFHMASIVTFYGGILLLLGGVNVVVLEFMGIGPAVVVLLLILGNVALTVGMALRIDRRKRASSPFMNTTSELTRDRETETKGQPTTG